MHKYTHKHMHVMYVKVGNPYASQHILSALRSSVQQQQKSYLQRHTHTCTDTHTHTCT